MTDPQAPGRTLAPEATPQQERNAVQSATRSARRSALQSRRRRRLALAIATSLTVGTAAIVGLVWADRELGTPEAGGRSDGPVSELGSATDVTLLYGTVEGDEATSVRWLTLIAVDWATDEGLVLYVPAHTAAEIPGRGLLPLADVYASGGAKLQRVSVENLFGLRVDRSVGLSHEDARRLFEAIEPLTVDVPLELSVAEGKDGARLLLPTGPQELSAEDLVDLLYEVGLDGDDAELGSRHLAFWHAYLGSPEARARLERALEESGEGVAVSDGSPEELRSALAALGGTRGEMPDLAVLPVEQAGTGEDQLFVVDAAAARDLLGPGVDDASGGAVAVQAAAQAPGIVALAIVVGKDYLRR